MGPPRPFLVGLQTLTIGGGSIVHGSVAGNGSVGVAGKSRVDGTRDGARAEQSVGDRREHRRRDRDRDDDGSGELLGHADVASGKTVTVSATVCYATVTVSGKGTLKLAPGAVLYANSVSISGSSVVRPS